MYRQRGASAQAPSHREAAGATPASSRATQQSFQGGLVRGEQVVQQAEQARVQVRGEGDIGRAVRFRAQGSETKQAAVRVLARQYKPGLSAAIPEPSCERNQSGYWDPHIAVRGMKPRGLKMSRWTRGYHVIAAPESHQAPGQRLGARICLSAIGVAREKWGHQMRE
ncbi:hypothetical protein GQ53DRAFT_407079 [Thozetella sp. PMI_491]|nr:hypothetical protein GQ53DRAFT_407079 [Thozetella sp. PMI_491]